MGLKGFYKLLTACGYSPQTLVGNTFPAGATFGVDADMWIYRFLYGATGSNDVDLAAACLAEWTRLLPGETTLVFSGNMQVAEKSACLKSRRAQRQTLQDGAIKKRKQCHALGDTIASKKQCLQRVGAASERGRELQTEIANLGAQEFLLFDEAVTDEHRTRRFSSTERAQLVRALQQLNIRCVVTPSEADFHLVAESIAGRFDYVVSDDADILASGCVRLVRLQGFPLTGGTARVYVYADVLRALQLNQAQCMQLATLLHCDYQPPIRRVGPKTALKYIRKHKSVAGFLQSTDFSPVRFGLPPDTSRDAYCAMTARTIDIFTGRSTSLLEAATTQCVGDT